MLTSTAAKLNLSDIKIPSNFTRDIPATDKLRKRLDFYKKTGCFDREIVVDENNILLDGYTTYLVCKMLGIERVRCLKIRVKYTVTECLDMAKKCLADM